MNCCDRLPFLDSLCSAFAECYTTPLKYYLIISFVSRQVTSLLMHGISAVSVLSVGPLCFLRIRATPKPLARLTFDTFLLHLYAYLGTGSFEQQSLIV